MLKKTRTHSSLPFLFVLFLTTVFVRFDVAVKEEEEAAVAAMDELAEANKEFLQGMGGVVGEEALEYVKFVFIVLVVAFVQENCYGKVLLRDNRFWRTARDLRLV